MARLFVRQILATNSMRKCFYQTVNRDKVDYKLSRINLVKKIDLKVTLD